MAAADRCSALAIARSPGDENPRGEAHYVPAVDAMAPGDAGPAADDIIASSRRRLLALIRARDADGAGREMEQHLEGPVASMVSASPCCPGLRIVRRGSVGHVTRTRQRV
jgi:DNA-binding GntR family transcriptional regulator